MKRSYEVAIKVTNTFQKSYRPNKVINKYPRRQHSNKYPALTLHRRYQAADVVFDINVSPADFQEARKVTPNGFKADLEPVSVMVNNLARHPGYVNLPNMRS